MRCCEPIGDERSMRLVEGNLRVEVINYPNIYSILLLDLWHNNWQAIRGRPRARSQTFTLRDWLPRRKQLSRVFFWFSHRTISFLCIFGASFCYALPLPVFRQISLCLRVYRLLLFSAPSKDERIFLRLVRFGYQINKSRNEDLTALSLFHSMNTNYVENYDFIIFEIKYLHSTARPRTISRSDVLFMCVKKLQLSPRVRTETLVHARIMQQTASKFSSTVYCWIEAFVKQTSRQLTPLGHVFLSFPHKTPRQRPQCSFACFAYDRKAIKKLKICNNVFDCEREIKINLTFLLNVYLMRKGWETQTQSLSGMNSVAASHSSRNRVAESSPLGRKVFVFLWQKSLGAALIRCRLQQKQ